MTKPVHTRTFKSGNSVAVRLPKGLDIAADTDVEIIRQGRDLLVRKLRDPASEKARIRNLIDKLDVIGAIGEIEKYEPAEFPDRPGLY